MFSIENVIRIVEVYKSSNENNYEEIREKCMEKIVNFKEKNFLKIKNILHIITKL